MKAASVYKRSDGWYFHADSTTTVGVGIGTPPNIKLRNDASDEALGRAVLEALAGSKEGVPHPTPKEGEKLFKPMLDLAGVKTWAAFAKNASSVDIRVDDQGLNIEPWKNEGAKMGFVPIPGVSVRTPLASSASEIGVALKKAIALCVA